jgi:hypothetical protein
LFKKKPPHSVYKANQSGATERPTTNEEAERSIIWHIDKLLATQLMFICERPRDASSLLMKNKLAAGYVFGFHDSCLQTFGRNDPRGNLSLMRTSYQSIFGDQSGLALFEMSIASQKESEFQIGREGGGEDYVGFIRQKTPPLGLQSILLLSFDAAAMSRTLNPSRPH